MRYRAIVVGASAGGIEAFGQIVGKLPALFSLPIIFVQHLHKDQDSTLARFYNDRTLLKVGEAEEKEKILPGHIYIASPDYHLLLERDETFSLSVDEKVNYSRPSIDVLFESAADVYGAELVGVLLTGANHDGARGLQRIKEYGGLTLVEDPATAKFPEMPRSALACTDVDYIFSLDELGEFLLTLADGCPARQDNRPVPHRRSS
ncbi:MAG: chemotaxis protein CheB [Candidatus Electrothrix sp. AR1]|nr:chemotaxis protein CheB [Candidatus Electrothrix sp. AR1]